MELDESQCQFMNEWQTVPLWGAVPALASFLPVPSRWALLSECVLAFVLSALLSFLFWHLWSSPLPVGYLLGLELTVFSILYLSP